MAAFNSKFFNPAVFLKYLETIPQDKLIRLLNSGVLVASPDLANALPEQVGGNYIVKPFKARLSGSPVIYDGATNITANTLGTYSQGIVVIGRAKGFDELDFTESITGHDFMSDVAVQLVEYWANVYEGLLLSILKGIFATALAANVINTNDTVKATTLNNAMQQASGDLADHFRLVFMHSSVATDLANLQLLEYIKYTDAAGIQRDTNLATWNGRLVFVTDRVPAVSVAAEYTLTSDVAIDPDKTYYEKVGDDYVVVAVPDVSDIATYYELTDPAHINYTTYVLGAGAFSYAECPVKVPVEMARDAATNGGKDTLYSRKRVVFAPYGVTFKTTGMSSLTPTDTELETGSAWELVKDASNNAISTKVLPFLAIITRKDA